MFKVPGLAWDACGLLNLAATGEVSGILGSFECGSHVVQGVLDGEVRYLRTYPPDGSPPELKPVSLEEYVLSGSLLVSNLETAEASLFIALARQMNDGEAQTAALAISRGFWIVTDDLVCLRVASENIPPIRTITTPEWVKHWAETTNVQPDALSVVIDRIQVAANYIPRRTHPLKSWWDSALSP